MVPVRSSFMVFFLVFFFFFGPSLYTTMIFCLIQIYFPCITSQNYDSLGLKCGTRSQGKVFLECSEFSISHPIDGFWLKVSKVLTMSQICYTFFFVWPVRQVVFTFLNGVKNQKKNILWLMKIIWNSNSGVYKVLLEHSHDRLFLSYLWLLCTIMAVLRSWVRYPCVDSCFLHCCLVYYKLHDVVKTQ